MAGADTAVPVERTTTARRPRRWLVWAGPLLVALGGAAWYLFSGRYVATDNAYVRADVVAIAPRIDGTVAAVLVASNAQVASGDVLVRLDDAESRLAVERAQAELDTEIVDLAALRLRIAAQRAALQDARAALAYREREAGRLAGLADRGIASRISHDAAVEDARAAGDRVTYEERVLSELLARAGGELATPVEAHPRVALRRAELERARLLLGYTVIRAPRDGQAGDIEVFVGEQVAAGATLLSLVGTASPWIEANLKETQLTVLEPGQVATVTVDAFPDATWQGRVASIRPATGAQFALLPPENASGNWVKVVQRVPVRLELIDTAGLPALRAGMSASVRIDTGEGNRRFRRWLSRNDQAR